MESGFLLPLAVLLQLCSASNITEDCAAYRRKRPTHTACTGTPSNFSIFNGTLSITIGDILWAHNRYRSQIALGQLADFPSAANMIELRWDKKLSDVAQALARQGTDKKGEAKHDLIEDRFTFAFPNTGQNVFAIRMTPPLQPVEWRFVVRDWFDQSLNYYASKVDAYVVTDPPSDAFTQLAWAETYAVGCGYAKGNMTTLDYPKGVIVYVCNYGPAGNELGKPLYLKGPTCSRCPLNSRCNETTGLCVLVGDASPRALPEAPEEPPPNLLLASSTPPAVSATSAAATLTPYSLAVAVEVAVCSSWLIISLAGPVDAQASRPRRNV